MQSNMKIQLGLWWALIEMVFVVRVYVCVKNKCAIFEYMHTCRMNKISIEIIIIV